MKANRQGRWVWSIVMLTVLVLLVSGCASTKIKKDTSTPSATKKDKGPTPLYYDFGDVLVPSELKLDKEGSFVFRTPGFSAGVLSYKGRVEINSLIQFFDNNMTKDNWQLVSSFKSRRTIMLFHKENRWCVINITEESYNTYTEIWVSPTTTETEAGLLK
jgi:hypothetical protein